MYLRELKVSDAPLILAWMHNETIIKNLNTSFNTKTYKEIEKFIRDSQTDKVNLNLAISSDQGEYMGMVSLMNIDLIKKNAELFVVVRQEAMGRGYSWFGIDAMINKAFNEFGIEQIFWCVQKKDIRASRFFDKHNFSETVNIPEKIRNRYSDELDLKWYSVLKGNILDGRNEVAQCKVIKIKTIPTTEAGELSFFESNYDIPFEVKRIYYITKVPEGVRRGFHAHKKLKQFLFCPYGRIQLILENKDQREEIELSDPSVGVLIDKTTWREMLWIQKDSVLCVAASDYYSVEDYIRDYQEFCAYVGK